MRMLVYGFEFAIGAFAAYVVLILAGNIFAAFLETRKSKHRG